jgi:hypothetical protein
MSFGSRFQFVDEIEVKQNLRIVARERGKIVAKREGHNIWLNLGREYLAKLIAYASLGPDIPELDERVKYMGLGIGGTAQLAPGTANAAPIVTSYPGTNVQTDTDPTVTFLERPVRISGGSAVYPGVAGDVWLGTVQAPAVHTTPYETTFSRFFSSMEVSYLPFLSVPVCEIMLFTSGADAGLYHNLGIAYDTFDTISKTLAVELQIDWTIRF